jgi:hypothetical protein
MIIIDIFQTPLQDQLLNCMGMMMEVGQTDVQDVSQIIFNVLITVIALKQTQFNNCINILNIFIFFKIKTI